MNSNQKVLNYNPYALDIYSLGLTLVLMKNLYDEVDFDSLLNKIKSNGSAYMNINLGNMDLNHLVDLMVNRYPHKRINAITLENYCERTFPEEDYPKINENNLIISLKYKKGKLVDAEYVVNLELLGMEYFKLLNYDGWLSKYDEILANCDGNSG